MTRAPARTRSSGSSTSSSSPRSIVAVGDGLQQGLPVVHDVSLHTDNVGTALQQGSDVEVRGIHVGEVASIRTDGDGVPLAPARSTRTRPKSLPHNIDGAAAAQDPVRRALRRASSSRAPSAQHLKSGDDDRAGHLDPVDRAPADLRATCCRCCRPSSRRSSTPTLSAIAGAAARQRPDHRRDADHRRRLPAAVLAARAAADVGPRRARAPSRRPTTRRRPTCSHALARHDHHQPDDRQRSARSWRSCSPRSRRCPTRSAASSARTPTRSSGCRATACRRLRDAGEVLPEFPCVSKALANYIPVATRRSAPAPAEPGRARGAARRRSRAASTSPARTRPATDAARAALPVHARHRRSRAAATARRPDRRPRSPCRSPAAPVSAPANSPEENQLIAELIAPTIGSRRRSCPAWSSLLLGPVLRGAHGDRAMKSLAGPLIKSPIFVVVTALATALLAVTIMNGAVERRAHLQRDLHRRRPR